MAKDGAHEAVRQVDGDLQRLLDQVNERAVKWASKHGARLVKDIGKNARTAIRDAVTAAEEEGLSNDDLADRIQNDAAFGPERAELVACTETAFADVQGNLIGWKEAGVVARKRWITSQVDPCERCRELDGAEVDLEDDFPGEGGEGPPLHPRCECDVVPVVEEGDQ